MERCAQVHPELPEVVCVLPDRPHWEHDNGAGRRWANVEVQAGAALARPNGLRDLARSATRLESVRLFSAASSGPVDPEPDSQAGAVLAHLIARPGAWTTGAELGALAGPGGAQRPGELATNALQAANIGRSNGTIRWQPWRLPGRLSAWS